MGSVVLCAQALTHARVPIVKFTDPVTRISCDICVNSKLLHDYSQVDPRLRQLAFLVKHWAKCRQVNETYRGTLSSYAYVFLPISLCCLIFSASSKCVMCCANSNSLVHFKFCYWFGWMQICPNVHTLPSATQTSNPALPAGKCRPFNAPMLSRRDL